MTIDHGSSGASHAVGGPEEVRRTFETALFEVKRVIVGQEEMLERVFVALLADGHILLEGVPGLAKTMTIKAVSDVLGGTSSGSSSRPTSCPPTWSARASTGRTAVASTPSSARCSATSCWPTRSTARPRRSSPRCSR